MQQDDERLITTSMREQEDETEVTLRPRTLAEYYGQTQVKEMLSVFIQAAVKRHEPLDHLLLYGPPGLGKTTLAPAIWPAYLPTSIRATYSLSTRFTACPIRSRRCSIPQWRISRWT